MILLLKLIPLQINYNPKFWIPKNLNNFCLHNPETPISNWLSSVQVYKKQFPSQQNAYYAHVEALTLVKKDNERYATLPQVKKYCSYCHRTNHSISACFLKHRDNEDKSDANARSKSPQKSIVQEFALVPVKITLQNE